MALITPWQFVARSFPEISIECALAPLISSDKTVELFSVDLHTTQPHPDHEHLSTDTKWHQQDVPGLHQAWVSHLGLFLDLMWWDLR